MNYKHSTVNLTGIKSKVGDKVGAEIGEVRIDNNFREASEKIQQLDAIQFNICQTLNNMPHSEERKQLEVDYINSLMQMYQITVNPGNELNNRFPFDLERRLAEFKSLINRGITTHPSKLNIALVIESKKSENEVSLEISLYSLLRTEGTNIIVNLFDEESFKSKGFFREIYDGNIGLLNQADALSRIDYLILGILDYSCKKGASIDKDLVSCNMTFSYKVINKNGNIAKVDSISVVGPGFSEDQALERGLEIISGRYSDRILNPI